MKQTVIFPEEGTSCAFYDDQYKQLNYKWTDNTLNQNLTDRNKRTSPAIEDCL